MIANIATILTVLFLILFVCFPSVLSGVAIVICGSVAVFAVQKRSSETLGEN